jgi:hypothetical protein
MGRIRASSSEMHAAETALLRSHGAMVDGQRRATLVFALLFGSRESSPAAPPRKARRSRSRAGRRSRAA